MRDREGGQKMANGRPRKTQDELDAEMEEYWNKRGEANGSTGANGTVIDVQGADVAAQVVEPISEDIDMVE